MENDSQFVPLTAHDVNVQFITLANAQKMVSLKQKAKTIHAWLLNFQLCSCLINNE